MNTDPDVQEWREAFVRKIGRCEWCGQECGPLCVHEIARGTSRHLALCEPSCVLVLGKSCHDDLHKLQPFERHIGLAILWHCRPGDYSLSRFWKITDRRWPYQEEVAVWIKRMKQ